MSSLAGTFLRFRPAARALSSLNRGLGAAGVKVLPGHTLEKRWLATLLYYASLFEQVDGVPGDVVECGVASGHSFAMLVALSRQRDLRRRIWGFDSWDGLPPPRPEDLSTPGAVARCGAFSEARENLVHVRLAQYGLEPADLEHVRLVAGDFADTLPHAEVERIALLHLDVDLYDSYRTCLGHLWSKVSLRGVVAFDEYGLADAWPGARLAIDEFFAGRQGEHEMRHDASVDRHYAIKIRS